MRPIILPTIALLASTICAATIDDVISSNSALTSQTDTVDAAVVALTADTDPTTASDIPPALQSLTSAISAAQASLDPTAPTADADAEDNVVRSYGLFANTVEELMADYTQQKPNLAGVFGLQGAIYDGVLGFNESFTGYWEFIRGTLVDASYQTIIDYNTGNATMLINSTAVAYEP